MTISRTDVQAALDLVSAKVPGLAPCMPDVHGLPLDGALTVEVGDDGELMLVAHERGTRTIHYRTRDLRDLVHQATVQAVWGMAVDWEWRNRERFPQYANDTRVTWVAKQIEIMRRIDPDWAESLRAAVPDRCPGVTLADVDAHPVLSAADSRPRG